MWIPILLIAGGTWILQDSIASILYYMGKDGQRWHYDQLLRGVRTIWGVVFICMGIILIGGNYVGY